jgi:hypothetical protein
LAAGGAACYAFVLRVGARVFSHMASPRDAVVSLDCRVISVL